MRSTRSLRRFINPWRSNRERVRALIAEVGLENAEDLPVSTLAHGDRKRLEFAMGLATEPEILLLDEPTAGMSPEETSATVRLIKDLHAARGLTVLLTEHDMTVVFSLANRISVMTRGKVIASGDPEDIRSNDAVIDAYLGRS